MSQYKNITLNALEKLKSHPHYGGTDLRDLYGWLMIEINHAIHFLDGPRDLYGRIFDQPWIPSGIRSVAKDFVARNIGVKAAKAKLEQIEVKYLEGGKALGFITEEKKKKRLRLFRSKRK